MVSWGTIAPMSRKPDKPLRKGWTTGACATAAVRAAYQALLTGGFPDPVSITLPKGEQPIFALAHSALGAGYGEAGEEGGERGFDPERCSRLAGQGRGALAMS